MITDAELEAVHTVMFRLETRWLPEDHPDTSVYHAWDPLPFWLFLEGIRPAMEAAEGKRFLDIGCGLGTKLAIMYQLGYEVHGIEWFEPYATTAKELMHEQAINILCSDAYAIEVFDADIVYMYRLAKTEEDAEALERYVVARTAPGALLVFPTRGHSPACADLDAIAPEVWRVP